MNERIKELAKQAGWGATSDPYARQAFDVNMFAELIVRECCSIADEVERADVPVLASKFIKAHFGVE